MKSIDEDHDIGCSYVGLPVLKELVACHREIDWICLELDSRIYGGFIRAVNSVEVIVRISNAYF